MAGHACLVEQDRLGGIDSGSDQRRDHLAAIGAEFARIIIDGDRVQVGEEEQALVLLLHLHPVLDRAQIITEMEITCGLNARNGPHILLSFLRGFLCRTFLGEHGDLVPVDGTGDPCERRIDQTAGADQSRNRHDSLADIAAVQTVA